MANKRKGSSRKSQEPDKPEKAPASSSEPQKGKRPAPSKAEISALAWTTVIFGMTLVAAWWGAGAMRVFCFSSVDSFWLIQSGLDIVSRGEMPGVDIYSFTHKGQPWVMYQWLFMCICGILDRLGGLQLLQAFVLGLSMFLFVGLAVPGMTRNGAHIWTAWLVMLAAIGACLTFMTLRPHLVSLILVYIVERALDKHWAKPGWKLLWLAPAFTFWANCHMIFALGLVMVFVHFASAAYEWFSQRSLAGSADRWQRFRILGVGLVAFVGASLVNPYGWDIFAHGAAVSAAGYWTYHIGEVTAPEFNDPVGGMILNYILLAVLSFLVSKERPPLPQALVFMLFLAAGLNSYKLIPYFVVATMQGTALRLDPALAEFTAGWFPRRLVSITEKLTRDSGKPLHYFVIPALAFFFGLSRPALFPPWVPVGAGSYLAAHPLQGPMFCSAKVGSYLIYRLRGQVPVFIDTRFDMYGEEMSNRYFLAHHAAPGWQKLFKDYGITHAVVEANSAIAGALSREPGWRRVYGDDASAIFVREGAISGPAPG